MTTLARHIEFFNRLVKLDSKGAHAVVEAYVDEHSNPLDLYADLLEPALLHAGREWECGRISVAHEHYLSEVIQDMIRRLGPRIGADAPAPVGAPVGVACCVPRERHCIGLMMVADALRSGGVEVHLLGEGLPAEAVAGLVAEAGADLLCLSCALDLHLPDMADLVALARQSRPGLTVAVGGAALRDQAEETLAYVGADWTAPDVREVRRVLPDWLRALVRSPTHPDPPGTRLHPFVP